MKRLALVFAAALAFVACGDNSGTENGTGTSIESESTTPTDNSGNALPTDTATMDTTSINSGGTVAPGAIEPSGATGNGAATESTPESPNDAGGAGGATSPETDNNQSR